MPAANEAVAFKMLLKIPFQDSFFSVEIFKGMYKGQNLNKPVASGTSPTSPHQLSKITPTMAMIKPIIILTNLSTGPTLHFIIIQFLRYTLH